MPPGSPIDPKRHQKLRKHTKKYSKKKHGGGFARSAVRYHVLSDSETLLRYSNKNLQSTSEAGLWHNSLEHDVFTSRAACARV